MDKIDHFKNVRKENVSEIIAHSMYRNINAVFKLLSTNQIVQKCKIWNNIYLPQLALSVFGAFTPNVFKGTEFQCLCPASIQLHLYRPDRISVLTKTVRYRFRMVGELL